VWCSSSRSVEGLVSHASSVFGKKLGRRPYCKGGNSRTDLDGPSSCCCGWTCCFLDDLTREMLDVWQEQDSTSKSPRNVSATFSPQSRKSQSLKQKHCNGIICLGTTRERGLPIPTSCLLIRKYHFTPNPPLPHTNPTTRYPPFVYRD
jgi:hypothetical protein